MLEVKNLSISFSDKGENRQVVDNLSFALASNQILAIVGESGSGKSISSLAILGLLPPKAQVSGEIWLNDIALHSLTARQLRALRGNVVSMIFQEPMSSLNPTLTCGYQVAEVLEKHTSLSQEEIKKEVLSLFEKVKLPRAKDLYNRYPHQISGGQKQRVMIAMALACKPKLLIADEPTTALDVTVQKEILSLLKELQQETQMSVLFISHDLALVSEIADRVLVMYQGKLEEEGSAEKVFTNPKKDYTKALMFSKPSMEFRLKTLPTVQDFKNQNFAREVISQEERKQIHQKLYQKPPILELRNLNKFFIDKGTWFKKDSVVKAVQDVSIKIYQGETLGLVGESGCGKTTLGRTILQLEKATSGKIFYKGQDITELNKRSVKAMRRDIQIIFQDPFSSLNPRISVGQSILEPMTVHNVYNSQEERKEKVLELLEKVGLEAAAYNRYPHKFSGGQRQRVGIARALSLKPKVIICDESVSALDVSVQAQVLNLLNALKQEFGFTYLFISHDLSVVKYMSDQLVVMNQGMIEEIGEADTVYSHPTSEYTKKLISSIPKGISSDSTF